MLRAKKNAALFAAFVCYLGLNQAQFGMDILGCDRKQVVGVSCKHYNKEYHSLDGHRKCRE